MPNPRWKVKLELFSKGKLHNAELLLEATSYEGAEAELEELRQIATKQCVWRPVGQPYQ